MKGQLGVKQRQSGELADAELNRDGRENDETKQKDLRQDVIEDKEEEQEEDNVKGKKDKEDKEDK